MTHTKAAQQTWWAHFSCQQYYDKQLRGIEAKLFWTARKGKTKNIIIWENWGCALKWFCQKWFLNTAIQGPILWQKAEEIALQLSIGPLSSGWTDRFRMWASLDCWTTSGESKCGSEDEVETQRTVVLPTLLAKYEPKEMSGADECSTFENLMWDKTCFHGWKLLWREMKQV